MTGHVSYILMKLTVRKAEGLFWKRPLKWGFFAQNANLILIILSYSYRMSSGERKKPEITRP